MESVPQIISTKDFAYLSDMFEWNYNAFKQINHFIGEVSDEEIKELLERVCNMHLDHLHFIIATLKQEEDLECDPCECEECEFEVEVDVDDEDDSDEDDDDEEDEEDEEDE